MKKFTWMMLALCTLACGCSKDDEEDIPKPDHGKIKGHEYVDLGLSVKWATCNVGADSPEDYGDYFAWGEITPKSEYTIENSITHIKKFGSICGNARYDAATANWGAPWRLPSNEECQELVDKCDWEMVSLGGHNGYKVTGPNGKSIFLPAAGELYGTTLNVEGLNGFYWSGTPENNDFLDYAYTLYAYRRGLIVEGSLRYVGQSVRPVTD